MVPSVKLEWIVIGKHEKLTEPRASQTGPRRPRLRTVLKAGLISVALIVVTILILRHRVAQHERQLMAEIQMLVDLEAQAVANSDRELFLSF